MIKFIGDNDHRYKVYNDKKYIGVIKYVDTEFVFIAAWIDQVITLGEMVAITDKMEILNSVDSRD